MWRNFKKEITLVLGVIIGFTGVYTYFSFNSAPAANTQSEPIVGAPEYVLNRTILPERTKDELGTSTRPWLRVTTGEICLDSDCRTTWPSELATSSVRGMFSATSPITYNSGTGDFGVASGFDIPLSASTTNWNTFYDTPSNRITAGTGLSWSGNTLNASSSADINYWTLSSGNVYRSSGRVGIGTASPSRTLDVAEAIASPGNPLAIFRDTSSGAGSRDIVEFKTAAAAAAVKFTNDTSYWRWLIGSAEQLRFDSEATVGTFTITQAGNVGIGEPTPVSKLHVDGGTAIGTGYGGTTAPTNGLIVEGNVGIGTTTPSTLFALGSGQISVPGGSVSAPSYSFYGDLNTGLFSQTADVVNIAGGGVTTGLFTATQARFRAGSASVPGISFINDANTGIFGDDADKLSLATAGVERLSVTSSGNVGIGTTNPAARLDVRTSNGSVAALFADATADATSKAGRIGVPHYTNAEEPMALLTGISAAGANTLSIGGGTSLMNAATELNFYSAANNTTTTGTLRGALYSSGNWAFGLNGGNVGVGTASPGAILDISGTGTVGPRITSTNGGGDAVLRFYSGSTYKGQVGWDQADDVVALYSAGNSAAPALAISNTGNVGIGTTTPGQKLSVVGNAEISGNVVLDYGSFFSEKNTFGTSAALAGIGTGAISGSVNTAIFAPNNQVVAWEMGFASRAAIFGDVSSGGQYVGIRTAGVDRLYVNSAGNIGIGTTAPSARLQIGDTTANVLNRIILGEYTEASENNLPVIQQVSVLSAGASQDLALGARSANGGIVFYTGSTGAADQTTALGTSSNAVRMSILANGNIGIGTTTPIGRLSMSQAPAIGGTAFSVYNENTGLEEFAIRRVSSNFRILGVGFNTIPTADSLGFGVYTSGNAAQHISAKGIFLGTSYSGSTANAGEIRSVAATNLTFSPAGTTAMTIVAGSGNVGIGTSTPATALSVVGTSTTNGLRISGLSNTLIGVDASGNVVATTTSGSGTVTSVGMTVPTGLSVSGSPVTGSGTLAVSLSTGYSLLATTTLGSLIDGATAKTIPADNDMFGLMDSAASNALKKFSWANLKTAIQTFIEGASMTLTGVWDFGGATSVEIPNGSAPTVDATGEIAVDTTSDQFIYYGASTKRVLAPMFERSLILASTTTDGTGSGWISATSTLTVANYFQPVTLDRFYCKMTGGTGTTTVRFGDGSNWTAAIQCGTAGNQATSLSNNTFTSRENLQVQIGSATGTSATSSVTITAGFFYTAD